MFVLRSHQPDTQTQPIGRLYAVTSDTESLARSLAGAGQTFGRRGRRPEAVSDCDSDVARTSAKQATSSRNTSMLPLFASAFAVRFGGAAAAIECPKNITDTQAEMLVNTIVDYFYGSWPTNISGNFIESLPDGQENYTSVIVTEPNSADTWQDRLAQVSGDIDKLIVSVHPILGNRSKF